jgi:RNA polymerase sigma-70 factor (ECF subfamily)
MKNIDERELAKKIIAKDEKSFFYFYKKHQKEVFFYVKKRIDNQRVVEELTQDIFVNFLEGLRDFHFQSSLKTFLMTIAKNKVIDYYRKKKIKSILFSKIPQFVIDSFSAFFLEEELEKKELQKKIEMIFKKLPNDYIVVLRQKYLEGKKVAEIARFLKIGFKATESLLYRARQAFIKEYRLLK